MKARQITDAEAESFLVDYVKLRLEKIPKSSIQGVIQESNGHKVAVFSFPVAQKFFVGTFTFALDNALAEEAILLGEEKAESGKIKLLELLSEKEDVARNIAYIFLNKTLNNIFNNAHRSMSNMPGVAMVDIEAWLDGKKITNDNEFFEALVKKERQTLKALFSQRADEDGGREATLTADEKTAILREAYQRENPMSVNALAKIESVKSRMSLSNVQRHLKASNCDSWNKVKAFLSAQEWLSGS